MRGAHHQNGSQAGPVGRTPGRVEFIAKIPSLCVLVFLDPRARPTCFDCTHCSKTDPGRWGWGRGTSAAYGLFR